VNRRLVLIKLERMHPHMLRHTFVTTMLDTGVDRRTMQIAARHTDPRTTMRYEPARTNFDRHPNSILAADMALRNPTNTSQAGQPRRSEAEPFRCTRHR
jgi:integrase